MQYENLKCLFLLLYILFIHDISNYFLHTFLQFSLLKHFSKKTIIILIIILILLNFFNSKRDTILMFIIVDCLNFYYICSYQFLKG